MSKIIITAAITGAIHIPAMSDYLPLTPEQIVEDAVKARDDSRQFQINPSVNDLISENSWF